MRKTGDVERLHGLPGVSRLQAIERVSRENAGYANEDVSEGRRDRPG